MNKYFEYLDNLRDSGKTNMFGAAPYLVEDFGITMWEARKILVAWMDTPNDRVTQLSMNLSENDDQ